MNAAQAAVDDGLADDDVDTVKAVFQDRDARGDRDQREGCTRLTMTAAAPTANSNTTAHPPPR
jgi:hypothetical protein